MGVSTDGIICYGVSLPEDAELPWGDDIEKWWRTINGYREPFELYTADGSYVPGIPLKPPRYSGDRPECTDEVRDRYFGPLREWEKSHPLPVKLVLHCSCDYPMWIVAAVGSIVRAHRGYPVALADNTLSLLALGGAEARLERFCREHGIQGDGPKWWLCSNWG